MMETAMVWNAYLRKYISAGALAAAIALSFSQPSYAEIEVVSSAIGTISPGTIMPDDVELSVPAGEILSLKDTKSGKVYEIKGPYQGQLAGIVNQRRSLFERIFGSWFRGSNLPSGGTRGLDRPKQEN
jgi:hypothetical protein